jgi:hypothetical protein
MPFFSLYPRALYPERNNSFTDEEMCYIYAYNGCLYHLMYLIETKKCECDQYYLRQCAMKGGHRSTIEYAGHDINRCPCFGCGSLNCKTHQDTSDTS